MYQNLLVATDGSQLSERAVDHAVALAGALGSTLVAFYVSPDYPVPAYSEGMVYEPVGREEYERLANAEAKRILAAAQAKAEAAGVPCRTATVIGGAPWEAILKAASDHGCDAIVMASHGRRGVSALLLGSETQKVLTHSRLPVTVVR
jgi:nucleotide-binding universal stress UspA family protein